MKLIDAKKKISIVLPVLNEESNISKVHSELTNVFSKISCDYELIFVDDGSTDGSLIQIKKLGSIDPHVYFIELSKNFGHQYALKAGLDLASGDAVITMDCDMEHPPEIIHQMLEKWNHGFDIVYTRRKYDKKLPLLKRATSYIFYKVLNFVTDIKLEAGTADFRLISRNVLIALRDFKEQDIFFRGLIKWAGFHQVAIDYSPHSRYSGKSKYSFKKMISFAFTGITSFSVKPLRLIAYVGLLMFAFSLVLIPYVLISYFSGRAEPGWTSVMIAILFFGTIQLFLMGIIALYVSKLMVQSKQRPLYLVRETNCITKTEHESKEEKDQPEKGTSFI